MTIEASAPGKLLLLGEYAVIEDGPALVACVNRRATGRDSGGRRSDSSVLKAVAVMSGEPGAVDFDIDTSAFLGPGGHKLGLGSSAACAVVASALALRTGDESALSLAIRAHRTAQRGEGSGVDVAAIFHGGVIAARRQPGPVEPLASSLPGLHLFALWTKSSAKTADLVATCRAYSGFSSHVENLKSLAIEGIRAWQGRDASRFLSAVARYGRAMKKLGEDANAPIVTPVIEAIMQKSGEAGAAAKPSGAGGGDVVVVFSRDPDLGAKIAEETSTVLLDLQVERSGLLIRDQKR